MSDRSRDDMAEVIKSNLLNFICDNFMVEIEDIDPDKSMTDEGIIDSFGLIEIASFIENQYGITVDEEHMTRDNFGSLNRIVLFIQHGMKSSG